MVTDARIEETVKIGEKNKRTWELVQNWCAHVSIEKFGGAGMIEAMYGVPIGHHSLKCPHAPAGGPATWDLADAAIEFYDRNCVDCRFRQAIGFPNLSTLVAERDERRKEQKREEDRSAQEKADGLSFREEARRRIRADLDPVAATTLDMISELDRSQDSEVGEKLVQTARLAPESFTQSIIGHLFALVDSSEAWLAEPCLRTLALLPTDAARLCNAALRTLHTCGAQETAAQIVASSDAVCDPALIAAALPVVINLASPQHQPFLHDSPPVEGPLRQLYRLQPAAVKDGIKALIGQNEALKVGAAARALRLLVDQDPALAQFMTDDLLAKLARAKWLVQGREDEMERALHKVREMLVSAFEAAPVAVDNLVQQYLEGAAPEGSKELHKLYRDVLNRGRRVTENVRLTDAHRIAFCRLVAAATKPGDNDERNDATVDMMQGDPRELTPIVAEEIDHLLGSAALIIQRLDDMRKEPADPHNPMAALERMGLRSRLGSLSDSLVRWACVAAGKSGPDKIEKVLGFLRGVPEGSEALRAAIIGNFSELAHTTEGLVQCLPEFYSALVGSSQLVRSHAATALGEMPRLALQNMPPLVFEAFIALMGDQYVIVHRAAVRALERFSLPEEFANDARRALSDLIVYYSKFRTDDRFLVTAVELYAHRYAAKDKLAGSLGDRLLEILMVIPPQVITQESHSAVGVLSENRNYIHFFLRLLGDDQNTEHTIESLLDQLDRRPPVNLNQERVKLAEIGVKVAQHQLWELPSFIEMLTTCGAWDEAAAMVKIVYDAIEDTTQHKMRRLHVALYRIACDFEAAIAAGQPNLLEDLTTQWWATLSGIEEDNAEIERRKNSS